ncbi:MAG TPA: PIG-L family deacetylase [Caulobacteraceae bacterium]|nr:PIG-L family deacetylase [Caulobacteraceae bacterium]
MTARFGSSILILAPHPDDEVVGFAAAIGRARTAGAQVSVIFLTHGCIDRESMWPWARSRYEAAVARRRAEAGQAAAALGVSVAGWSKRPARHLWRELGAGEAEVRRALAATRSDQVWAPAFEGGNPDHDGANAIASRLAAREGVAGGVDVLEFAEYNFAGGRACLNRFPRPSGDEQALELTPAEQTMKRAVLRLYASEQGNLGYVACEREAFRPLAAYDYGRPPHAGRLWFARFQWVPFRHPMVDCTPSGEVYAAIAAYLADAGVASPAAATSPV